MNVKRTFFVGVFSCCVASTFFAAEPGVIELIERKKATFIPLTKGFKTLVPQILVTLKKEGPKNEKKIDKILTSEQPWTLKGLVSINACFYASRNRAEPSTELFLPTLIQVNADTSIVNLGTFNSMFRSLVTMEACRQKKAVFYPYKQGAIISFFNAPEFDIDLLNYNESALRKMIDENREKVLELWMPLLESVY